MRLRVGHARTRNVGDQLPIAYHDAGSRGFGIFLVLFGLLFAGAGVLALVGTLRSEGLSPWLLFGLLFVAAGCGIIVLGLWVASTLDLEITDHRVLQSRRIPLLGTRAWEAPLHEYRSVLQEEIHHSGNNGGSYTEYTLTLVHGNDEKRNVELYNARSDAGFRAQAEKFARMFELPLSRKTPQGMELRGVEELDLSLRERIQKGRLRVDFVDTGQAPGRGLRMLRDGSRTVIEMSLRKGFFIALIFVAVGAAVFFFVGWMSDDFFVSFFGIVFGGVGLVMAVASLFGKEKLSLEGDQLTHGWVIFGREYRRTSLCTHEVEEVSLEVVQGTASPTLRIRSDRASISVGSLLSREQKEWLRGCLLRLLSR
jgi:hypothetical protein